MISIQNVSKTFGRVQAVRDVTLDIARGEFFSLLGASGSGKTTLLRMLAGFEGVTSGKIVIDGQPMQDTPPHLRPINMVFQNYAIFPHLNVRDNIAYGLRRLGTPKAEQARMVDAMLEMIALPGYGDRLATQLSGGQMQRVALARALILKPKVLLLDEPLGALDKQLREQMQLELRSLQRQLGITFVLVTHDQEEALTLSDRVAVMSNGQVIQVDTPSGLYDRPVNRQVAAFVGTMNFFDARIRAQGPDTSAEIAGLGRHPVAPSARRDGDRVLVAIRPEGFALSPQPPEGPGPRVAGRLMARQYLGGRQLLHVAVEGRAAPVAVAAVAHRGQDPWEGMEDNPVWLGWSRDAMTVLDAD
ncbi:Fe3+/spermidine/putrescine ABC transporter ATP-binding protein [Tabrizicola sp. TH137]|uniref:ABC transporter ATP-binding protein n=1 Tax=Tabrizicola sp. TH137 TaxID=2067452 RepID=UPI000C7D34C0|nr:ABC transporter ATP-binding protein [Tabrizicola sp. TH137]PLL11258.1 Fe3+/spermidine/putrescine ABC transporter ATP-binding protein [Tabrizicola sp. TH137]